MLSDQIDLMLLNIYVCSLERNKYDVEYSFTHITMLQRWRNPERVVMSVLIYIVFTIKVFVYCWLGSELSDQESIT
jgi:hypothetical protein